MKVFKWLGGLLLAVIILAIGFVGGFAIDIFIVDKPQTETFVSGDLSIHFLQYTHKTLLYT